MSERDYFYAFFGIALVIVQGRLIKWLASGAKKENVVAIDNEVTDDTLEEEFYEEEEEDLTISVLNTKYYIIKIVDGLVSLFFGIVIWAGMWNILDIYLVGPRTTERHIFYTMIGIPTILIFYYVLHSDILNAWAEDKPFFSPV